MKKSEKEIEQTANNTSAPTQEKPSFMMSLLEQLEFLLLMLAIVIIVFSFIGRTCKVEGESMNNTLQSNDNVFVYNLFYKPQRGDIVVFHQLDNKNKPLVKRVIGLPGETVKIRYISNTDMIITIKDKYGKEEVLEEQYTYFDTNLNPHFSYYETEVKDGTVFVLGDNRNNSADSRNPTIGLVDQRKILGKVVFRITPFQSFGPIN